MRRIAGTIAAVALLASGCGSNSGATARTSAAATTAAQALTPAGALALARRSFAVLRRPARPGDRLPQLSGHSRGQVLISRRVYPGGGDWGPWWLYVQGSQICELETGARVRGASSGGCADARTQADPELAANNLGYLESNSGQITDVFGIVPDGIASVTIVRRGGRTVVPVRNNVVVYGAPDIVSWYLRTPGGMLSGGPGPE